MPLQVSVCIRVLFRFDRFWSVSAHAPKLTGYAFSRRRRRELREGVVNEKFWGWP